jgi:multidrug efflux pump subunit AcrB
MSRFTIKPARGGPPGNDIDVRLRGSDLGDLKKAALEVKSLLETYAGVTEIKDNLDYGNEEIILAVNARGRSLGFSSQSVGTQVRNALEGAIAKRFPRGDEEVKIRIKYPEDSRSIKSLDEFYLRNKSGAEVLLSEVVSNSRKEGFARIIREGGQREVSVTAETDKRITNNNKILAALERDGLKVISQRNDVNYSFQGRAEEQKQTLGDMQVGSLVGLLGIYVILAWVFASYTRPIVVMAIIPLGFVGAVSGHLLLGYDLTILSLISLVGLSGIVVNDSIILVRTIDEHISAGQPVIESIISGTRDRLRAVILTSATTIGGLTPLLFETSLQARFLIPMAVTIIFGLAVTTLLVLFVAPAIMGIQNDVNEWWKARNW